MARTQKTSTTETKAPDFVAWHVQSKGDQTFWTRIGATWLHRDGAGMSVHLNTLPIDGRIVLRAPREKTDDRARA